MWFIYSLFNSAINYSLMIHIFIIHSLIHSVSFLLSLFDHPFPWVQQSTLNTRLITVFLAIQFSTSAPCLLPRYCYFIATKTSTLLYFTPNYSATQISTFLRHRYSATQTTTLLLRHHNSATQTFTLLLNHHYSPMQTSTLLLVCPQLGLPNFYLAITPPLLCHPSFYHATTPPLL